MSVVLQNMGVSGFSEGVTKSFYFAFITSAFAAGLTYYLLARFIPQTSYLAHKDEKFREWTEEEVEEWAIAKRQGMTAMGDEVPGGYADPQYYEDDKSAEADVNVLTA
jgi:hypothetical protein